MDNTGILHNDPSSVRYRRESNTLVVLGTGVIAFGFWSILKMLGMFIFSVDVFRPSDEEELGAAGMIFAIIIAVIIMAVDVLFRVFVGLRARRDGEGRKVSATYLVFTMFLILGSILSVITEAANVLSAGGSFFEGFASLVMELTSLVISIEVFIAGVYVRRFRKKAKKESTQSAG